MQKIDIEKLKQAYQQGSMKAFALDVKEIIDDGNTNLLRILR